LHPRPATPRYPSPRCLSVRSLRYADPRTGLLTGPAWEAVRPTVCRTVGVAIAGDEEITKLSPRLDLAYRQTAARVPGNNAVTITSTAGGANLSIEALDKIDEPLSLTHLTRGSIHDCRSWTSPN
jgi:hypothetical protein